MKFNQSAPKTSLPFPAVNAGRADVYKRQIVCFNSIDLAGIFEPMETPAATWISAVLAFV